MNLGIDLGTTFSVGSYIDDNGKPQVVVNSEGEHTTPSVVYFESESSVVVGQVAKDNSELYPQNVISLVKNSMGKMDKNTGKPVVFKTDHGEYSPETVSSLILKKIVSDAGKALGLNEPIKDVVVTIPAYFTDPQRKATEQAIKIAGLNCLGLINEPTAAAYYYASTVDLEKADILVYDLGGGTFDATVINVDGKNVTVKSTNGLARVGGSFFDKDIAGYVIKEIKTGYGVDLTGPEYVFEYQELLTKAEKAKIQLSNSIKTTIPVKAGDVRTAVEITRETFNGFIAKLYNRTEGVVKQVVKAANLDLKDIKKVILVGGSSRIPYIEEKLTELFGSKPSHEVNPDEVVAMGAALYARSLVNNGKEVSKITDVCSHGIGITALDLKEDKEYNDILIKRNTRIPAEAHRLYKLAEDGQREITVTVNEGDFKELTDVSEICTVPVQLPTKLAKNTQVDIKIAIDRDQLIHIYLRLPNNGNVESEVVFDRKSNVSDAQISEWRKSVAEALEGLSHGNGQKKEGRTGIMGFVDKLKNVGDKNDGADKPAPEKKSKPNPSEKIPKIIENAMEDLVGFKSVKMALRDYYNRSELAKKRALNGAKDIVNKNFVIFGEHGKGLTTAGTRIADVLNKIGAVNEQLVVADLDMFSGTDEAAVTAAIQEQFQKAMGGVLFIDNFEEFYSDNPVAAGPVTIDLIIKAYHSAGGAVTLIIAGEEEPTDKLFKSKRKLADLFDVNMVKLEGFEPGELVDLAHRIAKNNYSYVIDPQADSQLERYFKGEIKLPDFDYIHRVDKLLNAAITDRANKLLSERHLRKNEAMILRSENFKIKSDGKGIEELLAELEGLTGLAKVKKEVNSLVKAIELKKKMKEKGIEIPDDKSTAHMLFMGHAGTGKTTVARLLGKIFKELEVLPRGHVVEVTRKDLVSEFVGKTAKLVGETVEKALGGVLFIDEAYSLCRGKDDSFGLEAVDTLVPLIENHKNDFVVILAGYTDDMNEFLKNNQGLDSRFSKKIMFEDYSVDEMVTIFRNMAYGAKCVMEDGMDSYVKAALEERVRTSDDFGNARGVRNFFEEVMANHKTRIAGLDDLDENDVKTLRKEDIGEKLKELEHPKTVDELLKELNSMVGLASVKNQINRFVASVKLNRLRMQQGGKAANIDDLHMIFAGNPGTGKTTVARLLGQIMKGLGILPKGHCVECDRSKLVAGYVGQTAPKTAEVIESAIGGVLFIDEAYSLVSSSENDFGQEAITTLLKQLEDRRGEFMCIAAGYPNEMEAFLESNSGMRSRFTHIIDFEDYTTDELCEIFRKIVIGQELRMADGVMEEVRVLIEQVKEEKTHGPGGGNTFGNGREARELFQRVKSNMDQRLAVAIEQGLQSDIYTIQVEDVRKEIKP